MRSEPRGDAFRQRADVGVGAAFHAQHHDEFVAAGAGQRVSAAQDAFQAPRGFAQDVVADPGAARHVQQLELVDVHADDPRGARAARHLDLLRRQLLE